MKEKLIEQTMNKLLEYAQGVELFTKDNLPKYVEEVLTYEFMKSITSVGVGVALLLVLVVGLFFLFKYEKDSFNGDERCFAIGLMFMVFGVSMYLSVVGISTAYKIKYAPRVFLIDYLSERVVNKRDK